MTIPSVRVTSTAETARIAALFPSYRDFVDDALFHPKWGYYSTGQVRFGEGGHFDTFPIALSPLFGRMLAHYAYRLWRRMGEPRSFEICELGAGNGQLCLDALAAISDGNQRRGAWRRFASACRYRIIERSPALIARQRQQLGPIADRVTWTRADLTQRAARNTPLGPCGLVFANEVLDCLAHHRIVPDRLGQPSVTFVVPTLRTRGRAPRDLLLVRGLNAGQQAVPRAALARIFSDERLRQRVVFSEVNVPVAAFPALRRFLQRHYPEFFSPGKFVPYFACPEIEPLMRNTARLYTRSESLWIDYGHTRAFHLTTPENRRVYAGPPRSGASIYRAPGRDDITFMVDFSVVGEAAEQAGQTVAFYGGQAEIARRSGVRIDAEATDLIVKYRTLGWMLALMGVGPERDWRHSGLTWNTRAAKGGRLRHDVEEGIAEFFGERQTSFKLMLLRSKGV